MPTQRCLDDEGAARGELGAGLQSSQSWNGGQDGELGGGRWKGRRDKSHEKGGRRAAGTDLLVQVSMLQFFTSLKNDNFLRDERLL